MLPDGAFGVSCTFIQEVTLGSKEGTSYLDNILVVTKVNLSIPDSTPNPI